MHSLTTALILVMFMNCNALSCAGSSYSRGCCGKEAIAEGGKLCSSCNTIPTKTCCVEGAITDYFQMDQFEKMFSNWMYIFRTHTRNDPNKIESFYFENLIF